jgi:MFS family permease
LTDPVPGMNVRAVTTAATSGLAGQADGTDSVRAWLRLAATIVVATIGGVGMWSVVVALPAVQAEFGVARADASLPFTLTMLGFAAGGVPMGRLLDRFGILAPVGLGTIALAIGYIGSGYATSLTQVAVAQGLAGVGTSAMFGPLMADASRWFIRRRGIAVSLCAAGNYLAGVVWPPLVQHVIAASGWRSAQIGIGIFCAATILPLAVLALRRPAPLDADAPAETAVATSPGALGLSSGTLQVLLSIAGVACCVAMSMPQVHLVAYCGDLGYGPAHGADMLAAMMAFGIVSRIATGFVADRIGGLPTLLVGSALQGAALFLYLFFDGLASLYVISALFGLFQGGIIPSYAIIVREYFAPQEAGIRLGIVLTATLIGMALGGWMSGLIFDVFGSYRAAFANGLLWNLLNVAIAVWLLLQRRRPAARMRREAAQAVGQF